MKIHKLIVTGFGPYALRQELDFENNLQDKNMFVITGNTGAGKTTIFDAINFALYGDASGADREAKYLRSDFADSQTPTEVELWFSVRSKEYYVKRAPEYIRPKKRGEGFVKSEPSAEIKLSKDKTITGVTQVTKEVESILGITKEQFKQLVMIPQGEFKRLLNAKSDEKEDIFRKIFGTETFQNIQGQIKQQSRKLEGSIKEVQRDRLNKIRSFEYKEKDEDLYRIINADEPNIELIMKNFYEFIERDREEQKELEEKKEKQSAIIGKISNEIAIGETINKKFEALERNKKELDKLNEQVENYKNKEIQVSWAKKALNLKIYEDKYNEKNRIVKSLNSELEIIEKNLKSYKESYEKAEEKLNKEKSREEERNKLIKDIDKNQTLKEKASQYEISRKKVDTLEKKVKAIKDRIKEIGLIIIENNKNIDSFNNELEEIKKAKEEKGTLEINHVKYKNKQENLKKLSNDINLWISENKKYEKAVLNFDIIEKKFKESKDKFEFLEDTFRKNQAGILASGLEEGTPCPVCGSVHHPNLTLLKDSEITEEMVRRSKEVLECDREQREKGLNELTAMKSSLKSRKDDAIDPNVKELLNKDNDYNIMDISSEVNESLKQNNNTTLELESRIESLNNIINKENEKIQARDKVLKDNENLRKELEEKNEDCGKEEGILGADKSTLEAIKNDFKGEIKTVKELDDIILTLNKHLQNLKEAYDEAEKEFTKIKDIQAKENGRYERTKEMKEKADEELKEAISRFKANTLELGFQNYADYKEKSLNEEEIEKISKEIDDFKIKLEGFKKLYEASLKEIEGLSTVDLGKLREKLETEKTNENVLDRELKVIFARISNNVSIAADCEKYNKAIER